eukprot:TRINITY_DN10765_c0_g2_i3.p1 TRINITY_DN10765_c0_g2~~TRINITY_DN10765_c0_g2_i3.p1  ORF type:complete len:259 (+),score=33.96 TRINITY_DN10765_c0_g2_i3:185-961(+)
MAFAASRKTAATAAAEGGDGRAGKTLRLNDDDAHGDSCVRQLALEAFAETRRLRGMMYRCWFIPAATSSIIAAEVARMGDEYHKSSVNKSGHGNGLPQWWKYIGFINGLKGELDAINAATPVAAAEQSITAACEIVLKHHKLLSSPHVLAGRVMAFRGKLAVDKKHYVLEFSIDATLLADPIANMDADLHPEACMVRVTRALEKIMGSVLKGTRQFGGPPPSKAERKLKAMGSGRGGNGGGSADVKMGKAGKGKSSDQ